VAHDAAGNITSDGTNTYTYSDRGRLATMTNAGGTVTYSYNALELRVGKTGPTVLVPTGANYYVYDEEGRLLGEYDANGTPLYETIYLSGPVGVIKQTGTASTSDIAISLYNVSTDQLGAPRIITRQSDEAIAWRWDSAEAFGATAPDQNPGGLGVFSFNQRLPGQVFDAESGLFQNWKREYNPRIGRYMQSDPLGLVGGINTFAYVGGNPLSNIDPRGLDDPSYLDRVGVTARGLATGAFGALVGVIAASPPEGAFNNMGFTLYDNSQLAQDFQNGHNVGYLLGAGGAMGASRAGNGGGLTRAEMRQIQTVVNEAGRPLDVVGSAAAGTRRGAGTNLPIGKGPGTRSDIDYVAGPSSLPYFAGLQGKLPGLDPKTGVFPGCPNPNIGPSIRFEPR